MINNSPFDDHIKKRLGNYEPEVPSHIWENIMAEKEKRRPGGFLFKLAGKRLAFILSMLVLSAGGALLIHSMNNNSSKNNPIAVSVNTTIKDQHNVIKKEIPGNKNDINIKENKSINNTDPVPVQNINPNTAAVIPETNENNISKTTADNKIPSKQIVDLRLAGAIHKKINTGTENAKVSITTMRNSKEKKGNLLQEVHGLNTDVKNEALPLTQKNSKIKNSTSQTRMQIENPEPESTDIKETGSGPALASINNNDLLLKKYHLDLDIARAEKTFSFSVKNINIPALNIPCPGLEKNAAANKRYFEVYGGPDYTFRSFNDTANSAYEQKRKESTHFSSAFSFGIRYTKVFNNSLSFRTGINYSQVNEKFKYEQGHLVQLVYIIDANGDTTGSYATTGTRYKVTHNRYRTLDIPLTLGYEMGNGRFHTNINAGLVVNIYSWQKGDLLDDTYQPVNITTGKTISPYQFKTNVGLGFMGGASFYYKLTGSLHILAEPYFRYNFSAANKPDITLKQKYTTAGVRLGLRIDF